MKKLILIALMAMTLAACDQKSKEAAVSSDSFLLTGRLTGLGNDTILLGLRTGDGTIYDTAIAKNDSFSFAGKCPELRAYTLQWWMTPQKKSRAFRVLHEILIENGHITVSGNIDSPDDRQIIVQGSASQKKYNEFLALTGPLHVQMDSLETLFNKLSAVEKKKQRGAIDTAYQVLNDRKKKAAENFIAQNPNSPASAYIAWHTLAVESPVVGTLDTIYRSLDPAVRRGYFGRQLDSIIASLKLTAIGMPAPAFTLSDTGGNPVSLDSYRGKVVLIDFWASWCGPCRRENPNVVSAYRRFHPKGFEILGVSLDKDRKHWIEAIVKDTLAWQHISDLKGWNSGAAKLYAVRAIPDNYLIGKDGKILARGLHGDDLVKELGEVLK